MHWSWHLPCSPRSSWRWLAWAALLGQSQAGYYLPHPLSPLLDLSSHAGELQHRYGVLAGVAAGATRAALTHHFARAGNAADVSAKEGTQVRSSLPRRS